jgi:hypothetical protein
MAQLRSILTALSTAFKAALTSAAVFSGPSEKRIICRDAADSGFIAFTTWDGSSESARHAEPEDAQTPS